MKLLTLVAHKIVVTAVGEVVIDKYLVVPHFPDPARQQMVRDRNLLGVVGLVELIYCQALTGVIAVQLNLAAYRIVEVTKDAWQKILLGFIEHLESFGCG